MDFIEREFLRSRTLYSYSLGNLATVVIEWDGVGDTPLSSATALLTEHSPMAKQYQLKIPFGEKVSHRVPAGQYSVAVFADGREPYRTHVEIPAGQVTSVSAHLKKNNRNPPSFAERVAKFGVDLNSVTAGNLEVKPGTQLALDPRSADFRAALHQVKVTTLEDVKKVLGHSDEHWPTEHPRFGELVAKQPTELKPKKLDDGLRSALREYVYGNSKSIPDGWKQALNNWLQLGELQEVSVLLFNIVTVGPGSVLEVGGSAPSVLTCDILRVHITGTVSIVGVRGMRIETGTYEEFG